MTEERPLLEERRPTPTAALKQLVVNDPPKAVYKCKCGILKVIKALQP